MLRKDREYSRCLGITMTDGETDSYLLEKRSAMKNKMDIKALNKRTSNLQTDT